MITKFDKYINESVRDKMTPKSEDDIIKALQGLDQYQRMYKAIEHGILSLVEQIIENGIDLKKNVGGGTPAGDSFVDNAVQYGKLDILKYLLDNGCDLDNSEDHQLGISIEKGYYDIAKFLVNEYGASVDDGEGDVYLQMAVEHNNLDLVKLVIDMDCHYFEKDWFNDIILIDETNSEIIKYMMEKISGTKEFVEQMYNDYKEGVKIIEKYV